MKLFQVSACVEEKCILTEGERRDGINRGLKRLSNFRRKMGENIFGRGESDIFSAGPGEDAVFKCVFGNGTVISAAAGDEPDVYAMGDHILNGRCFRLGSVLLKKIEGGAGRSNRVHLGIGKKSPAVPIGRGIHGTDIGEADAEGIIEGGGSIEGGIAAGTAADGREVVDNYPTLLCQLLKEMIGGDILFIHTGAAGTVTEENDGVRVPDLKVLKDIGEAQPVGGAVTPAIIEDKRGTGRDIRRNIEETFGIPIDGTVRIGSVRFGDQGIIE